MTTFCVTFPQWHPLRDHWIEIQADTESHARAAVVHMFGTRFAFCYSADTFRSLFYPAGKAGPTVDAGDVVEAP